MHPDPLGVSKDASKLARSRLSEIKNGRLAMVRTLAQCAAHNTTMQRMLFFLGGGAVALYGLSHRSLVSVYAIVCNHVAAQRSCATA